MIATDAACLANFTWNVGLSTAQRAAQQGRRWEQFGNTIERHLFSMKNRIILLLAISVLGITGAADIGKFEAPSDILVKGYAPRGVDFVLSQVDDMRKVYCDLGTLTDREKRKVCFLDSKFGEWHREAPCPTNATLRSVFSSVGFTNWNGGRQIRIIKKMLSFKVVFRVQ